MSAASDKPALDAILQKVLEAVPFQLTSEGGADAARQRFRDLPRRPVHPEVHAEDRTVDGPGGPIPIRLYRPAEADGETLPVVMFFHGGGWVVGDLDSYDGDARHHAAVTGALVVSVDYRLAPEHPYPAAVDDVWAATQWVAAHADDLGADANRLAVAGDSAGGNLSAVVAQLARDAGGPQIAFQLLWYPATTWDTSLPSFRENAGAPILDLAAIGEFSRWYAGHVDMANAPSTLVPARAADLSGLPPAYIAVAGHDPLRDDGVRYGELLAAAGVPVEVHNAETLVHGYLGYAGIVPAATEAVDRGLAALRGRSSVEIMTETSIGRPDIDPILKALLDAVPLEFTIDDGIEVARDKLRALKPPLEMLPDMRIEERVVGLDGATDVPVRIYWPPIEAHDHLPVVVFYHGGGWAVGDLDTHDHVARAHAVGADAIVVSVDYRLAPEHPFPAAVDDAWTALRWVGEHAEEIGGDPARIAVAGDSAGGNLSAVMALRARDAGGPPLVYQLLWYPVAVGDLSAPSFTENADAPILNDEVMTAFLTWYLPGVDTSDPASLPTDVAPANAATLAGLAPAFIGTAEHDPLRDDGGRYAELLTAAGVPVTLSNESTMVHGYVSLAMASPAAAEATDRGIAALKAALHAGQ